MKDLEINNAIERLEKEIRYLYIDYHRMTNQSEAFHEIRMVKLKIKQAEESLRLKRKILYTLPAEYSSPVHH